MSKSWFFAVVGVCYLAGGVIFGGGEDEHDAYIPTSGYEAQDICGWHVYVAKDSMAERGELYEKARRVLEMQLFQIARVVPAGPLGELRKVKIWFSDDRAKPGCACYHPSKGWLANNGWNPDKAKGVDIYRWDNFVRWTVPQPSMVLHELAHAYHDQVLGWDNENIIALYEKAKAGGAYNEILHVNGGRQKAYGMNNVMEYFAETAEAFFGTNDMYPFVKSELKEIDPAMFAMHERVWSDAAVAKKDAGRNENANAAEQDQPAGSESE